MPFDLDILKTFFEKATKAVDWFVEEIIWQRNWRSLLVLLDVILFLAALARSVISLHAHLHAEMLMAIWCGTGS